MKPKCIHHWLTDVHGRSVCRRCSATKQWPGYGAPRLKAGATGKVTRKDFAVHPDFAAKTYVKVR